MKDEPGGDAEEIGCVGAAVFVGLAAGAGSARRRFWSGVCCERLVSLGTAVWGLVLMGLWALEERLEEGD